MEKYKDKPTSKFEGAAFAKYVHLWKTKATGMGNQHDEAISGGYEDKRDELREVPNDVVRETESKVPMEAGPEIKYMVSDVLLKRKVTFVEKASEETASLDDQEDALAKKDPEYSAVIMSTAGECYDDQGGGDRQWGN